MHRHYTDIISRIAEPPLWFDENAVPRFEPFSPDLIADIYADEACLLQIACQACGRAFDVCISWGLRDRAEAHVAKRRVETLADLIRRGAVHYGDPPNVECCPAGPTMNSEPRRVLQYWKRSDSDMFAWSRDAALEIDIPDEEAP
jgi:hypothetical protein